MTDTTNPTAIKAVVPAPRKRTNPLKLSVYAARDGTRWRMTRSGRIVAESGEGYSSAAKCRQTLTRLLATIAAESYVWEKQ